MPQITILGNMYFFKHPNSIQQPNTSATVFLLRLMSGSTQTMRSKHRRRLKCKNIVTDAAEIQPTTFALFYGNHSDFLATTRNTNPRESS